MKPALPLSTDIVSSTRYFRKVPAPDSVVAGLATTRLWLSILSDTIRSRPKEWFMDEPVLNLDGVVLSPQKELVRMFYKEMWDHRTKV